MVHSRCGVDLKYVVSILSVKCKGWSHRAAWFALKSAAISLDWYCDWFSSDRYEAAGSVSTSVFFVFEVGWIHQPLHSFNGWSFQALIRITAQLLQHIQGERIVRWLAQFFEVWTEKFFIHRIFNFYWLKALVILQKFRWQSSSFI